VQAAIITLVADVGQRLVLGFAFKGEAGPTDALAALVLDEDDERARLLLRGPMAEGDLGFFPGTDFDLLASRIGWFRIPRWSGLHDRDRAGRDTLHRPLAVAVLVTEWPECLAVWWHLDGVAGHRQARTAI